MKEYFKVNVAKYVPNKDFDVVRPASLNNPKDNAVMFVTQSHIQEASALQDCQNCLIFWPSDIQISDIQIFEQIVENIYTQHAVCIVKNARNAYCSFFKDNNITYYPPIEEVELINGSYISKTAKIGNGTFILPGSYIGGEVEIGNNCYIGSGVRLVGEVHIGNDVVIRENTVIGADGLSTDRDNNGHALTMPQFGGVVIEDNVQVGALTVIARGAIDNTIIRRGSKIDNSTFISHNVVIGENTFIVGETIMFGSSSTGEQVCISGNSTVRDGRHIGDNAVVGMGAVVVKDVADGVTVKGNPAK